MFGFKIEASLFFYQYMFLYLTTDGLTISKSGGRFIIKQPVDNGLFSNQEIPISLVEGIVIFGKIQLTTDSIRACLQGKIPVFFLSKNGNIFGKLDSLEIKNVELLYSHIKASLDSEISLNYAKSIIISKIKNSKVMLQRRKRFYKRDDLNFNKSYDFLDSICDKIKASDNINSLRGFEGASASEYFECFSKFIITPFSFNGRNRRPPKDPINSMLSLGYTLLAQTIQMILNIQGIEPQIGFIHQPKDLKSLLVLDLMEMFRAWIVDDLVIRLIYSEKIQESHFLINEDNEQYPCLLTEDGLKIFIDSYYQTIFKETSTGEVEYLNNFKKLNIIEKEIEKFKQSLVTNSYNYEGFKIR